MSHDTQHSAMVSNSAVFSPCRKFRYDLWRAWKSGPFLNCLTHKRLVFIGLNPSTADETKNDPTVTRCVRYAQRLGFSGVHMLNLYGFRSTNPDGCRAKGDGAIGPANDSRVLHTCLADTTGVVVAAWGAFPWAQERGEQVVELLTNAGVVVNAMALTRQGYPRHPLYLRKDLHPIPWRSPCRKKKPPPPPRRKKMRVPPPPPRRSRS